MLESVPVNFPSYLEGIGKIFLSHRSLETRHEELLVALGMTGRTGSGKCGA